MLYEMSDIDLKALKKLGLSVLQMRADEWADLQESRGQGLRFTSVFLHGIARAGISRAPALIAVEGGRVERHRLFCGSEILPPALMLAWIKSIQGVATRETRVSFEYIQSVAPDTLDALIGPDVPTYFKASATELLARDDEFFAVGQEFGEWLLDRLASNPTNEPALRRLTAMVDRPALFSNAAALQQDALSLALKAFGAPAAEASELALSRRRTTLASARTQENLVIAHDARWIPGWHLAESDITGRAVFQQGNQRLDVFTANHEDLERLFGVDLIYLNQTRRSLVMVQYKMMEPSLRRERRAEGAFGPYTRQKEAEWVVPINNQFKDEMARMMLFDSASGAAGSYRMNPSPFFFKFVRRYGSTNGAGILLSLGHLQQLLAEGQLAGSRGGLRIAYGELNGHYLRNESFIDLVQSGYIGSRDATTDHLEVLIEATLSEGRGIVAAIQSFLPHDPRNE